MDAVVYERVMVTNGTRFVAALGSDLSRLGDIYKQSAAEDARSRRRRRFVGSIGWPLRRTPRPDHGAAG